MTDLDLRLKLRDADVREQASKVREARSALAHGYLRLNEELEREMAKLDREKAYQEFAKEEAERGFENSP